MKPPTMMDVISKIKPNAMKLGLHKGDFAHISTVSLIGSHRRASFKPNKQKVHMALTHVLSL